MMMSCALASVEHVHQELELMRVVQHCRGLVDVVADCRLGRGVRAELHTLLPTSSGGRFSSPGFGHVGLDTVELAIAGSHKGFWCSSHCADWLLPQRSLCRGKLERPVLLLA